MCAKMRVKYVIRYFDNQTTYKTQSFDDCVFCVRLGLVM